jgi:hypothetical protein
MGYRMVDYTLNHQHENKNFKDGHSDRNFWAPEESWVKRLGLSASSAKQRAFGEWDLQIGQSTGHLLCDSIAEDSNTKTADDSTI